MTDLTAISAPTPAEDTPHAKTRPVSIRRGWQAAQLAALIGAYALFLTQPLMTVSSSARHLLETIHGMSPGLTVGRDDFIAGIERMTSWFQFDINAEQAVSYTVFSRGGSVDLNRFRAFHRWFSASLRRRRFGHRLVEVGLIGGLPVKR